ncbi:MAG: DUF4202 family protein [Candidatus Buchananbacteria bacterium]
MERFAKVQTAIKKIIKKSPLEWDLLHAQKTLFWLLKLNPEADEILKIAALAHDLERGVTGITETTHLKNLSNLKEFKREHAKRSSEIIGALVKAYDYSPAEITRLKKIVENHEVGGDQETDILRDADSIAYFDQHIEKYYQRNGAIKTKDKISFMFDRVSDPAKQIIKQLKYKNSEVTQLVAEVVR